MTGIVPVFETTLTVTVVLFRLGADDFDDDFTAYRDRATPLRAVEDLPDWGTDASSRDVDSSLEPR